MANEALNPCKSLQQFFGVRRENRQTAKLLKFLRRKTFVINRRYLSNADDENSNFYPQ